MWNAAKAALRGKFIALKNACITQEEKSQVNNFSFYSKKPENNDKLKEKWSEERKQ